MVNISKKMECPKCEYGWGNKKDKSKEFPSCKNRLNYYELKRNIYKGGNLINKYKEVRK